MTSIEAVRGQIRGALQRLPLTSLDDAVDGVEAAGAILDDALAGSSESADVVGGFHHAAGLARELHRLVVSIRTKMLSYVDELGGGSVTQGAQGGGTGRPVAPVDDLRRDRQPRQSRRLAPDEVAELERGLPPPVPKPNPDGKKTHGVWVDEFGERHVVVSGRDSTSAAAWRRLQEAGMSPAREPAITSHVEAKLATQMVNEDIRHVDVVVNNRPCPGVLGCDTLLPILLPEGFSMTVHGPRYRKTFSGGKKWSS